jgi:hypothetical protein
VSSILGENFSLGPTRFVILPAYKGGISVNRSAQITEGNLRPCPSFGEEKMAFPNVAVEGITKEIAFCPGKCELSLVENLRVPPLVCDFSMSNYVMRSHDTRIGPLSNITPCSV